jgi:hypothetical protein
VNQGPAYVAAATLIDLLVHSTELTLRDRLVLETGLAAAATDSGALWRREPDGVWRPSVERGRRGGRFETERAARRALENPLAPSLPGFACVRAELGARGVALVLASPLEEEAEDALEALLACMLIVELASGDAPHGPEAPLPAAVHEPGAAAPGELGRIQHDVRNALTSLMATRQVLERFGADLGAEERRAYTDAVSRECERTGSILALGLLGVDGKGARMSTAAEITLDVLALERAELTRAGCEVRTDIDAEARALRPACGAESWSRIVRNLVTNAREAAAIRGGRSGLEVALRRAGNDLRLTMEDAAGGLPAIALPTLFEAGFSAGKAGGSGRGLEVVRALVVAARGAVFVQRREGGARFEVWMPAHADPGGRGTQPEQGESAGQEARGNDHVE